MKDEIINQNNEAQNDTKAGKSTEEPESETKIQEIDIHIIDKIKREMPKNAPTVFQSLGQDENKNVLRMFLFISTLLVVVGFGSFFLSRKYIPTLFPSITPYDSPIYACLVAVVLTQIIIFTFYFWAWKHDVEEEKREKQKND